MRTSHPGEEPSRHERTHTSNEQGAAVNTTFRFEAARMGGAVESGVLQASDRDAAVTVLADRGLFPFVLEAHTTRADERKSLPLGELALGLRILADFLESGLPMGRSLSVFTELAPTSWRQAVPVIRERVREGKTLAAAMADAPAAMPPVVLGIIRAGEVSGELASAVRRAAELMEHEHATRSAIRSALAYPALLAVASISSIALLIGIVLPRFAAVLADLGQALPRSTSLVLAASDFARAASVPGLFLGMLSLLLLRVWTATEAGRIRWHVVLLQVPGLGTVRRSAATSRSMSALAALLRSGVPLPSAISHAARAGGDSALEARLEFARSAVLGGERLSHALDRSNAATATVLQLVRAGEESGNLAPLIERAAVIERERAERLVRAAVRLIEPALILVFGVIVALVASALLQAIYGVRV